MQHNVLAVILQKMTTQPKYSCDPKNWVELYSDQLFRFAFQRVNKRELAEDLVHDTFVSALNNLSGFKGESTEKTWLYSILRNKIIDYYRSSEKKMSSKFYNIDDDSGNDRYFRSEGFLHGAWIEDKTPGVFYESADEPLEREEFMQILKLCMDFLPFKWAEVFRMKNMEELNSKEICKELDITPSNLWVIIHRAKLQLRECMEDRWTK